MFRSNIFTILLFGSLCVSVTTAGAEVVFKENFSGFYASGTDKELNDPGNAALNNRDLVFWPFGGVSLVETSTIATYDTTGGLRSVPLTTNPAISASDIPADRGGNIVNGALLFKYPAGIDSWKETRFTIETSALDGRPGLKELWVQYDQFIPTNFKDRGVAGHWGSKTLTLYADTYGNGHPRLIVGRVPAGSGDLVPLDSYTRGDFRHTDESGTVYSGFDNQYTGPASIERGIDLGKWQRRTLHIKLPTNQSSNDGVIEYWIRHGNNVVRKHIEIYNGDFLDINEGYLRHGYLLGWSNNGFDEDTSFLITNFILAESAQHIDKNAIVYVAAPNSPATLLAVKE